MIPRSAHHSAYGSERQRAAWQRRCTGANPPTNQQESPTRVLYLCAGECYDAQRLVYSRRVGVARGGVAVVPCSWGRGELGRRPDPRGASAATARSAAGAAPHTRLSAPRLSERVVRPSAPARPRAELPAAGRLLLRRRCRGGLSAGRGSGMSGAGVGAAAPVRACDCGDAPLGRADL